MTISLFGVYFDSETGSIYLRARYYDPSVGRFISEDTHWNTSNMIYEADGKPSMEAILQSSNLYVYVMNNPLRYTDPTGLWGSDTHRNMTIWVFRELGLSDYHANIVATANVNTDRGKTGPMPWQDQSRHFDRNEDANIDSRQTHADNALYAAIYNWNWADQAYANGEITFEERHEWRVNALTILGQGLHSLQDIDAHLDWGTDDFTGSIWKAHSTRGEWGSSNFDNPRLDIARAEDGQYDIIATSDEPFGSQRYANSADKTRAYLKAFYSSIDTSQNRR